MVRYFPAHGFPSAPAGVFDAERVGVPVAVDHAQGQACDVVVSHLVGDAEGGLDCEVLVTGGGDVLWFDRVRFGFLDGVKHALHVFTLVAIHIGFAEQCRWSVLCEAAR